jgi:hypothetical protein
VLFGLSALRVTAWIGPRCWYRLVKPLQRGDYDLARKVDEWRLRWGKPVVIDEFGYDGDLDQGWGNLTSEEVVRRFWRRRCAARTSVTARRITPTTR